MSEESPQTVELVQRAAAGDADGWTDLVERYRDRLQRMIAVRIDRRMQQRVN